MSFKLKFGAVATEEDENLPSNDGSAGIATETMSTATFKVSILE